MVNILKQLFRQYTGKEPVDCCTLSSAGSNRHYYRLRCDGFTAIGAVGTSVAENRAFIAIARQLKAQGISVPAIYAVSDDERCYLQQDLGDVTLFDVLMKAREQGGYGDAEYALLRKVMRALPDIHYLGANNFDFSNCYPSPSLNKRGVMWDLNYFKYCFLKATGLEFEEERLEDDFERLAVVLLEDEENTFMYRDLQSRNIMLRNGEPWFIDFQGGRRGPVYYDIVSMLWQARAQIPSAMRQRLINEYLDSATRYRVFDTALFMQRLPYFVLFRTLQVLGTYGYRGYFEHKAHFVQSIPMAIDNLRELLQTDFPQISYLTTLLKELVALPRFAMCDPDTELTVRVSSFSYKKGIPDDCSGNGGGFVFDCRAIHNPGRYDEYKAFTGHDACVRAFLDQRKEMQDFLQQVYALVDYSVEKYRSRGFKNLMVNFGCTGGQHRSVYAADHLAAHLHEKWGVRVILTHREQTQLGTTIL